MIPSLREIASSLAGALRLFLFDARGYEHFNFSREGFWRSFFAAILIAPPYFWVTAIQHGFLQATASSAARPLAQTFVIAAVTFVLYWLVIPWILLGLTSLLGTRARFSPLVTVFNWSAPVVVLLETIPFAAYAAHLLPVNFVQPLFFASIVASLLYRVSFIRTILGLPAFAAVGIAFSDLLTVAAISLTAQALV